MKGNILFVRKNRFLSNEGNEMLVDEKENMKEMSCCDVSQAWLRSHWSNRMNGKLRVKVGTRLRWTGTGGGAQMGRRSCRTAAGPLDRPSTLTPSGSAAERRCSWTRFLLDSFLASQSSISALTVGKCSGREPTLTERSLNSRTFSAFQTRTQQSRSTERAFAIVWALEKSHGSVRKSTTV